jgi:hypothetical protein
MVDGIEPRGSAKHAENVNIVNSSIHTVCSMKSRVQNRLNPCLRYSTVTCFGFFWNLDIWLVAVQLTVCTSYVATWDRSLEFADCELDPCGVAVLY